MTTREQQLERALWILVQNERNGVAHSNDELEDAVDALAVPRSAEAVAPKPVRALHDRRVYIAITRNEDYEDVDDVLVASDFLETPDGFEWEVITSPTDTLRDACKELVKEWRWRSNDYGPQSEAVSSDDVLGETEQRNG